MVPDHEASVTVVDLKQSNVKLIAMFDENYSDQKYLLYAGSFPVPLEVGGSPLDVASTAHQSCHCSLHLTDTIRTSIIIIATRSSHQKQQHHHHHHCVF